MSGPVRQDPRARFQYGRIPTAGYTGYIPCAWSDCYRDGRAEITATVLMESGNPGTGDEPVYNTQVFCSVDHRLYWLNSAHPERHAYR